MKGDIDVCQHWFQRHGFCLDLKTYEFSRGEARKKFIYGEIDLRDKMNHAV